MHRFLALLFPALLLVGCANSRVYFPGGYDMGPVPTMPIVTEEDPRRIGVAVNTSGGYNDGESNTNTEFSYTLGTGSGWNRIGGKGFIYTGFYSVRGEEGARNYTGAGLLADGSLALRIGRFGLGIGAGFGGIFEIGPYTELYLGDFESRIAPLANFSMFASLGLATKSLLSIQALVGIPGGATVSASFFDGDKWGASFGFGQDASLGNDGSGSPFGRVTVVVSYGL